MIKFDPNDRESILSLMHEHGNSEYPFFGETESGEVVEISIFEDRIVTRTAQGNGWMRINVYHLDGTCEELYER